MNTTLIIILICAAVIAIGVGGILFVKKFGINYINIAQSLVLLVKSKMTEYNIGDEKYGIIMDLVLQGLVYIQYMSSSATGVSIKVSAAFSFIQNLLKEAKITLSDDESEIIKLILKIGFIFMDNIGFPADSVTESNYIKIYKSLVKYAGESNLELENLGLKKEIK